MDSHFNLYIMGRLIVGKAFIVVLIIHNPPRNFKDPKQLYSENNKRAIIMMQEAANKHSTEMLKFSFWEASIIKK